jgi:F0F1-type ATP synthase assembly protein I
MVWLFFINPFANISDFNLIGWVHLYMLGFVMMAIFSAMAQLGPIVVETKHYNVNVFKYVWIFLVIGLSLMLFGFYIDIVYLIYGGIFVLIAMSIYAIEFLLTLRNTKRRTSITKAMKMSNFFLLLGIISGIIMALGFNNLIDINPKTILNTHTFGLVVGFVILLIMGISIILIPMFGLSKRISDNEFSNSFITLSFAVGIMMASPLFLTTYLQNIAYGITVIAIVLYLFQLYKMTSSRAKVVHDIWAKSMYVGFISFVISFVLLISYLYNENELILKLGMWIMLVGFFGFLIIGNFYKIIPFLVWFHIYSPLIEQRAVPMLHELLPKKLTNFQWIFSTMGLIISSIGITIENEKLFFLGLFFLSIGAVLFFVIINKILKINI